MKKLFYIFIFLFLSTSFAFSATYHITQSGAGGKTGADEANADTAAEFNADNINDGATGMAAGDTIYFYGTITTTIIPPVNGSAGNHITLDGYATDDTTYMSLSEVSGRAKIDMGAGEGTANAIDLDGSSYITIQDLEATDCGTGAAFSVDNSNDIVFKRNFIYSTAADSKCESGISMANTYNITIGGSSGHGNVIKNIGDDTSDEDIALGSGSMHDIIISYNHLYADNAAFGIDGIMCETNAYDILVEYNSIHGHNDENGDGGRGENGIDIKRGAYNWIIRYNSIYDHDYESDIILNGNTIYHQSADQIYIYGNKFTGSSDAGISTQYNAGESYDNIYIFSNIFSKRGNDALKIGNTGTYYIYNNVFAENSQVGDDNNDAGVYIAGSGVTLKNNIFYKNRPNDTSYLQLSLTDAVDETTTADYNWYWWPSQTSEIHWGSSDLLTVDQVQAGSSNGLPQETGIAANEGDPGLTDIANGDYTIASGAAVIGVGVDLSQTIATLNIQGQTYPIYSNIGLDPATDWTTTPPTVIPKVRSGSWDLGAYVFTSTPDTAPTFASIQTEDASCPSSPVNINHGCVTNKAAYCRQSTTEQTYDVMTSAKQMTGGEGTIYHWSPRDTACGQTVCYWTACSTAADDSGYESDPVEICRTILAAPLIASQQGIIGAGNVSITGIGNVSVGGGYIEMLGSRFVDADSKYFVDSEGNYLTGAD